MTGGGVEENERFIKKTGTGDGQIAAMMGLHASFTLSDRTLERCVGIAKDAGVGCHIHVAEDAADREDSVKKYGMPTVMRLEKLGAAGSKSLFIHCVHIDEAEMDRIVATDTAVVHNPESNMNNAVGVTPLLALLKKGALVGLGTDGMSSDMLAQMRCAYLLHRLANRDPRVAFHGSPPAAAAKQCRDRQAAIRPPPWGDRRGWPCRPGDHWTIDRPRRSPRATSSDT